MVTFFLVIVAWGILFTGFFQHTLRSILGQEGLDNVVIENILRQFITISTGLTMGATVLVLFFALFLSKTVTKSIDRLIDGVREVASGKQNVRIEISGQDEFSHLAYHFNKMTKELDKSRNELITAKEYTDSIVKSIIDTLIVVDANLKIRSVNKATCDLLGYREEELTGQPFSDIFIDEMFGEKSFRKLFKKNSLVNHEIAYKTKSGEPVTMLFSGAAMTDKEGGFHGIVGIAKDITDRKHMEESLKKLKNAIEQAAEVIIITDSNGIIEYANPSVRNVAGYSPQELTGKNVRIFKSGRHDKKFYKEMWSTILSGRAWQGQMVNRKKSGELYDEEMAISPVMDDQGKITNFIAVKRDISEEQLLRSQLMQAEKLSSIGTFISGVAHELNNPLTSILGCSQMIMEEKENLPAEIVKDLQTIEDQSVRAAEVVKNLLRFCRKQEPGKAPLQINELIEDTLNLQSYQFQKKNIKIQRDYTKDLPLINGESGQLQQVFMNIILNAHHEMTKARGKKGVLAIRTQKKGDKVSITFENNGSPIPENRIQNIFDPFFTTKEIGKGTGLGLSVSFGIVKDHGGRIRAENAGIGVRFIITLPVPVESLKKEGAKPASKVSLPKGLRVLVVEDEKGIMSIICRVLSRQGASIQQAENGEEAVDLILQKEFEVVLSDIRMPRMDGFELGNWFHANKPDYLKKFVLVTGNIDQEVEDYCSKRGCRYLMKPFNQKELLDAVHGIYKIE